MTDNQADLEQIKETVQLYFDGLYTSDSAKLNQAFHETAFITGHFKGTFVSTQRDKWTERVGKTKAPSESGEEYDMEIVSVDITGDAASVKVADLYLGFRFTDYLSLLKLDGRWQIANKIYYHQPTD